MKDGYVMTRQIGPASVLAGWVAGVVGYVVIDLLWLGLIAGPFYQAELAPILKAEPSLIGAAVFYAVYPAAIMWFAVAPGLRAFSLTKTLREGAVLGFSIYCVYNSVNLAVIEGYGPLVALVDTIWGCIATPAVATCAYFAARAARSRI